MLIQLLQNLYWPCWYIAVVTSAFTALLALYYGLTVIFGGHRAPAPKSRVVYVIGWIAMLSLGVILVPALSFFAFIMPTGIADFVRDPETFKVSLSFLGGVRVLSGDEGYLRLLVETGALAALGGRGVMFALMMWPESPRRDRTILDTVLHGVTGPYDDK
jgi:hypothetical protein